jgi:hypothetical protein
VAGSAGHLRLHKETMTMNTPAFQLDDHVRITLTNDGSSNRLELAGQTGRLFANPFYGEEGKVTDIHGDFWVRLDTGMPGYISPFNDRPVREVCMTASSIELVTPPSCCLPSPE